MKASGWAPGSNGSGHHAGVGHLNEAHNGYLEVYLNLGIIGVILIIGFLIAGYRNICKQLTSCSQPGLP